MYFDIDSIMIDRMMNNLENSLSHVSAFPVIGTLAGVSKVIMGVTQMVTALACVILSLIPAAVTNSWSFTKHSWSHVEHGIGNIIAGIFESIFLLGTFIYLARDGMAHMHVNYGSYVITQHENKFMPYDTLVDEDWRFGGYREEDDGKLQTLFEKNKKAQEIKSGGPLSRREQLKLAQASLDEHRQTTDEALKLEKIEAEKLAKRTDPPLTEEDLKYIQRVRQAHVGVAPRHVFL